MARYFSAGHGKRFAKIVGNDVFMRAKKDEPWSDKGGINTDLFLTAVSSGCWLEISALEAGDRPYADCSQCAENWPELFDYHPDGYLVSKVARGNGKVKPGKVIRGAVNKYNKNKSRQIAVNGKKYHLHRIVYEIFNGPIPDGYYIENADESCEKIENLKLISHSESGTKRKPCGNSGIKGVLWIKARNKWGAQIKVNTISHHLGYFDNINDAIKARICGEIKYFGKQINNFPDYISPEEAERRKQGYYEGEEMKQIEINTEPPEPAPEPAPEFEYNTFRFKKRDIRINSNNYINLVDLFRAMRGSDSEQFRQQIASFEQVAVFGHFLNRGEDYDAEYFAPPLMAQMFMQRLGSACDGVELINTYHAYCNVMMAAGEQVDSKQVEDLKGQVKRLEDQNKGLEQEISGKDAFISQLLADKAKAEEVSAEQTLHDANEYASACRKIENLEDQISELQGLLNVAREDRNNYQDRANYWNHQYNQANKAFGEEQDKRQKLERENDNLVKNNCELRQKLNAANNDDAKAKAAADKQTINDLRADLQEARETINEQQQEADSKALVIRGYQLKVAELEDDKDRLQHTVNAYQSCYSLLSDRYNKLVARILQRRAAQKRYMGDLHQEHVTDSIEWMQAIKAAGDWHKRHGQRRQQRYRKLVRALQQRVKDLLYRLDKKPERAGFWSKIKDSFHVQH